MNQDYLEDIHNDYSMDVDNDCGRRTGRHRYSYSVVGSMYSVKSSID